MQDGAIKVERYYLSGGTLLTIKPGAHGRKLNYLHTDRLGSPVSITEKQLPATGKLGNAVVTLVEHRGFDAFGKALDGGWGPSNNGMLNLGLGELYNLSERSQRGFTGHEHLDEFALIHMNGRVYDYNLGRFLGVDPIIQFPSNSQSLNPYSYLMNNPLSGTDPTGYAKCGGSLPAKGESCTVDVKEKVAQTGTRILKTASYTVKGNGAGTGSVSGNNAAGRAGVASVIGALASRTQVAEKAAKSAPDGPSKSTGSIGGVGSPARASFGFGSGDSRSDAGSMAGGASAVSMVAHLETIADEMKMLSEAIALMPKLGVRFAGAHEFVYAPFRQFSASGTDSAYVCFASCEGYEVYPYGELNGDAALNSQKITIYRGAFIPREVSYYKTTQSGSYGQPMRGRRVFEVLNTPMEKLIWTLAHEAAHTRGVDNVDGVEHSRAQEHGHQAVIRYRRMQE